MTKIFEAARGGTRRKAGLLFVAFLVLGGCILSSAAADEESNFSKRFPQCTVFTVINNTSVTPISGNFANLPDGSFLTSGGNTFQATYEGGDGNDLTLTVVP